MITQEAGKPRWSLIGQTSATLDIAARIATYVAIVQPVMSDGKVAYLLDLAIPTEIIATIIRSQLRHPEWLIGVTGNDDRMIARNWESERYVGKRASDAFIQNTRGDEGVFQAPTLDGVKVFTAYTRSKLTGWRVGTGIP